MQKEKQVKTYQRRTKSGKMTTVKAHTAKYNAAEDIAKEIIKKKKGAGKELEELKKKPVQLELPLWEDEKEKEEKKEVKEPETKEPKAAKSKKTTSKSKTESSEPAFTKEDFKAWYHWDTENDPKNAAAKKVEKALKKQMGAKEYKKYFDSMTDGWSARGHLKAYNALSSGSAPESKSKEPATTKKGKMSYAEIDSYKGDPAKLSTSERRAWTILHGYHNSSDEKKLRSQKSLKGLWDYIDGKDSGKSKKKVKDIENLKSNWDKATPVQIDKNTWRPSNFKDDTSWAYDMVSKEATERLIASQKKKKASDDSKAKKSGKDTTSFSSIKDLHKKMRSNDYGDEKSLSGANMKSAIDLLKKNGYKQFESGKSLKIKYYVSSPKSPVYTEYKGKLTQATGEDDYRDFITGHNGYTKKTKEELKKLGWGKVYEELY